MSNKKLAKYVVALEAETTKYQRELEKAQKQLRRFDKGQADAIKRMAKQFGVLAAAAGTAFAALARQVINSADRFAKMSQMLGVSTEFLSELDYAADLAGVSLDQLQTGLQRLARTASDSANGLSTATRAFNAIGVNAQNADGTLKDTETLLMEVAEAFSGIEDGAAKAAVAQELFGRAGTQLIPLLNEGTGGLQEMREEAARLGVTIGTDAAGSAEQFNDNLTRLQRGFTGLVSQSVQQILPAMEAISDRFVENVNNADGLSRAVDTLATAFKGLLSTGMVVVSVFKTLGTSLGAAAAAIVERDFDIIRMAYDDMRNDVSSMFDDLASVWGPAVERAATAIEEPIERVRRKIQFGGDDTADEPLFTGPMFDETLPEQYDDGGYLENLFSYDKLEAARDKMMEVTDEMSVYADQAARNMQDSFADFLFDPFEDGVKGMLKGFIDTLRRMAAEMASSLVFDAIKESGIFGGLFGGPRAMGGPVAGGTAYLVGEQGPELFVPGMSGMIVPNHAMGGGVTVNIDARGSDNPERLLQLLPVIKNSIKSEIYSERRRGING